MVYWISKLRLLIHFCLSSGARAMGKHLPKLSWQIDKSRKGGGRWYVVHNRKPKFFSGGQGKSDREGKRKAQEKAADYLEQQENGKPHKAAYESAIKSRERILEWCRLERQNLTPDEEALVDCFKREIVEYKKELAKVEPAPPTESFSVLGYIDVLREWAEEEGEDGSQIFAEWSKRLRSLNDYKRWTQDEQPPTKQTVSFHIDDYLRKRRRDVKLGELLPGSYKPTVERLAHFKKFCGDKDIQSVNGQTLENYRDELLNKVEDDNIKFSSRYAQHCLTMAKSFVRKMYESEVIDSLPRNINRIKIFAEDPPVTLWSKTEVDTMLENGVERTKLFTLLMLNCAMYPSDIAELKQMEVDWRKGTITRKRTKTKKRKTAPEVTYYLWDETFKLLKKHRSKDKVFVFLNGNKVPLVRRELKVAKDGTEKVAVTDNVKDCFKRVWSKLKVKYKNRPDIKSLRKTSASKLGESTDFARYAQYFLAQAPTNLADKRYVVPSDEQFKEACAWLGEQFSFETKRML